MDDMKKRIDLKQKELRGLSDDEIREMHIAIYDCADKSKKEIDAILLMAVKNEVLRRWQATSCTSWIWKRNTHAVDYKKWNAHHIIMERKAIHWAIKTLSDNPDPKSQEKVIKLKKYLATL